MSYQDCVVSDFCPSLFATTWAADKLPFICIFVVTRYRKSRQRLDRHGTIELASHTRPTIHLIGGTMNRYGLNVQGSRSTTEVLGCRYNICFLGVTGFNPSSGFCCENEEDCLLKQAVIRQSDTIVVLMDSKKYGQYNTYSICQCDVVRYGPC